MQICEFTEMPNEYALTRPSTGEIIVRIDTYINAASGGPRERFILAHELGHMILHADIIPEFSFSQSIINYDYRKDAGWQANEFAAWFLVDPQDKNKIKTPKDMACNFQIEYEIAVNLWWQFRGNNII
jgi:Zn-dependent peptidase ImmA (M78 family)